MKKLRLKTMGALILALAFLNTAAFCGGNEAGSDDDAYTVKKDIIPALGLTPSTYPFWGYFGRDDRNGGYDLVMRLEKDGTYERKECPSGTVKSSGTYTFSKSNSQVGGFDIIYSDTALNNQGGSPNGYSPSPVFGKTGGYLFFHLGAPLYLIITLEYKPATIVRRL